MTALTDGSQPVRALGNNASGDAVGSLLEGSARGAWLWSGGKLDDVTTMVSPQWRVYDAVAIDDLAQQAPTKA